MTTAADEDKVLADWTADAMRHAARELSAACDTMFNDPYRHNRDNWNRHANRIKRAQRALAQITEPPARYGAGCPVCRIGKDGKPYAYTCSRNDCPTRGAA